MKAQGNQQRTAWKTVLKLDINAFPYMQGA